MTFKAWEVKRRIERNYYTALRKLRKFILRSLENARTLQDILDDLSQISESDELDRWSHAYAHTFATAIQEEDARTWRQAAAKSSAGLRMYKDLQKEMSGPVGDRVREIIDNNAHYIKTLPQTAAKEIVRFTGTQAFADNRESYTADKFKALVGHMTENHAKLISRTETSKAHAALTQARSEATGLNWYIWHTSEDERVRSSHRIMDDVMCRYSDAPHPEALAGEKDAGGYSPGNIYNCRCFAEPVIEWGLIKWPMKVYASGQITRMSKHQFEETFGKVRSPYENIERYSERVKKVD